MANEPIQGGPYPLQSERADVPGDIKKVVDWAAPKVNMTFPTTAERDAQVVAPEDGMECFVGSGTTSVKYVYVGGEWVPISVGATIAKREGAPASSIDTGITTDFNPGPVSYSYGGITTDGGGFIVPTAGVYMLSAGLRLSSSTDSEFQLRLRSDNSDIANQSSRNSRYYNVNCIAIVNAGAKFRVDLYNNHSSAVDLGEPGFGGPYLAVALISPTVAI